MRNSNFELLRIISILLILMMHVASMAGSIGELNLFNKYSVEIINSIGNVGVSCFILISGYFGVKLKSDKFLHIILLTTFYSIFVCLLNSTIPSHQIGLKELIQATLVVPLYHNWFISCYLILMLLSPFLETFSNSVSKKNFEKLLLFLFISFSVLPTLFNTPYYTILTSGGKCLTYFVFIYLIGRYLKQHQDFIVNRKKTLIIFLISTVIINVMNLTISAFLHKTILIYAMDCSPFILISSICIFYFFKSCCFQSSIINQISSSVIAVYLLDGTRLFFDHYIFHITSYSFNFIFTLVIISEVLFCFTINIFIDKTRYFIFNKIEKWLIQFILVTFNRSISKIRLTIKI